MKTYGQQFKAAMSCQSKEEASKWMAEEVRQYKEEYGIDEEKAVGTILHNLGYMAGYYDKAASEKVFELFNALHPIFGSPEYWDKVTAEEAFLAGIQAGNLTHATKMGGTGG